MFSKYLIVSIIFCIFVSSNASVIPKVNGEVIDKSKIESGSQFNGLSRRDEDDIVLKRRKEDGNEVDELTRQTEIEAVKKTKKTANK
ncbi:hypothetical protein HK096_001321, partial [Nowakowskiella sp. JEL0078]